MQQHSVAVVGLNEIFGKIVLTESSWARGESGKGKSEGEQERKVSGMCSKSYF